MYVPYDMSKVKVLDLSQNFSMDSPSFAFYEGPTVKWVKRLAFEGVNAQFISTHQPHRDPPRLADPLLRSGPGHRGHPDRHAGRPGLHRRPLAVRHRRLPDLRPRALRGVGAEDRHHDRARRHPGDPHRLPPLLQRGLVQGPQPGEARPAALLPEAPRAAEPLRATGCSTAASAGWRSTASPPTTRSTPTCARRGPDLIPEVEAAIGMSLDEAFPWPADYQCMHVKLFPHGVFHAENVGGQIDEVLDQRVWLGCFPFRFKGGEAAFAHRGDDCSWVPLASNGGRGIPRNPISRLVTRPTKSSRSSRSSGSIGPHPGLCRVVRRHPRRSLRAESLQDTLFGRGREACTCSSVGDACGHARTRLLTEDLLKTS